MRRLSLGLTLLLLMALIVSACGGAAAPAAAPEAAESADAEATVDPNEPTPVPTPVVNAFGECDDPLILWHGLTGTDGAVFASMLEQFSIENPDACLNSEGIP